MTQEKGTKRNPHFDHYRIYNQCQRKKGFTTTKDVNKIIQKHNSTGGCKLSYYRCDYCGKYHLTKKYVRSKF